MDWVTDVAGHACVHCDWQGCADQLMQVFASAQHGFAGGHMICRPGVMALTLMSQLAAAKTRKGHHKSQHSSRMDVATWTLSIDLHAKQKVLQTLRRWTSHEQDAIIYPLPSSPYPGTREHRQRKPSKLQVYGPPSKHADSCSASMLQVHRQYGPTTSNPDGSSNKAV